MRTISPGEWHSLQQMMAKIQTARHDPLPRLALVTALLAALAGVAALSSFDSRGMPANIHRDGPEALQVIQVDH